MFRRKHASHFNSDDSEQRQAKVLIENLSRFGYAVKLLPCKAHVLGANITMLMDLSVSFQGTLITYAPVILLM